MKKLIFIIITMLIMTNRGKCADLIEKVDDSQVKVTRTVEENVNVNRVLIEIQQLTKQQDKIQARIDELDAILFQAAAQGVVPTIGTRDQIKPVKSRIAGSYIPPDQRKGKTP